MFMLLYIESTDVFAFLVAISRNNCLALQSTEPIIRANTIIALGDLTFRFPNLIEPWTAHLYAR